MYVIKYSLVIKNWKSLIVKVVHMDQRFLIQQILVKICMMYVILLIWYTVEPINWLYTVFLYKTSLFLANKRSHSTVYLLLHSCFQTRDCEDYKEEYTHCLSECKTNIHIGTALVGWTVQYTIHKDKSHYYVQLDFIG